MKKYLKGLVLELSISFIIQIPIKWTIFFALVYSLIYLIEERYSISIKKV